AHLLLVSPVMDKSGRSWAVAAILVGIVYLVIGRVFALPTQHVRAWRLAAWVMSGVFFAAQLGYELFRLRNSPRTSAWHVALAAALGGFLLAVAAAHHSLVTTSAVRPLWLVAFVAWP